MRNVKLANRLLWGLNALLAAGIVAFAWFFLIFSADAKYLKDFRPDEDIGAQIPAKGPDMGDGALKSLNNPVEKKIKDSTTAVTLFKATLKGTLPSEKDPKRGIAFIKSTAKNAELVAYMGEEILHEGKPFDEYRGWSLAEVSKDRALFKSASGQEQWLSVDQSIAPVPGAPGAAAAVGPGKTNRIGQAYASDQFKSRLLASSDNRQVWGMDQDEIDWAVQNADKIMDQDFQVSPYAGGGVRVEGVNAGSIGAARGMLTGDIIREVNGQSLNNITDVRTLLGNQSMKQQSGLRISIERAGKPVVIEYRPLPR